MKSWFGSVALLSATVTIAFSAIAAAAHTRYRQTVALGAPAIAAKPIALTPLDRPMALTVSLPAGGVLEPDAPRVAQSTATILLDRTGELTDDDEIIESDNSRFDVYLLEGSANQTITITVNSRAFNTFLMLVDRNGDSVAQNNDISAANQNSAITATLPSSGVYLIIVNSFDSQGRGSYRVSASTEAGTPAGPTVSNFECKGGSTCTVTEGEADYMAFSYIDPNGNASEWTLNDFTAEIYPVNSSGTIRPSIQCTCPGGSGNCNAPVTNTYTVSLRDTSDRQSNRRSVSVTCAP